MHNATTKNKLILRFLFSRNLERSRKKLFPFQWFNYLSKDRIREWSGVPNKGLQIWRSSVNIHHSDVDSVLDSEESRINNEEPIQTLIHELFANPRILSRRCKNSIACPIIVKLSIFDDTATRFIHTRRKKNVSKALKLFEVQKLSKK